MIILYLLAVAYSQLQISYPQEFKDSFVNNSIRYSVANFGHIPFDKTLFGNLIVLDPIQACNMSDIKNFDSYQKPFLLMKRGQCTFVTKVLNAEKLGAKLAIIMDNVQQYDTYLVMKDDGNGYKVNIPSLLISEADGQKLISLVRTRFINLKVSFSEQKNQKVNLTLWLEANNRMSYHLIRTFKQYYTKLANYINLTIIHQVKSCRYCKAEDCYFNGSYCALDHNMKIDGKYILDQQLRETQIFTSNPSVWWDYMDQYDLQCVNLLEAKACTQSLLKKMNIDYSKIQQQVNKSMEIILKNDIVFLVDGGINSFPAASVNHLKVRGTLKAEYLFQQICSSLKSPPPDCYEIIYQTTPKIQPPSKSYWPIILVVVSILIVLFVFCVCRRRIRSQLSQEMSSQVNSMVSKYMQMHSQRK